MSTRLHKGAIFHDLQASRSTNESAAALVTPFLQFAVRNRAWMVFLWHSSQEEANLVELILFKTGWMAYHDVVRILDEGELVCYDNACSVCACSINHLLYG